MAQPTKSLTESLPTWLANALKAQMEEEFELLKEEYIKELDRKKDAIIAGLVLHASRRISVETVKDKMIIEVHTETIK